MNAVSNDSVEDNLRWTAGKSQFVSDAHRNKD